MSMSDDVHAELRHRLIAGQFSPGEKIREEHIAAELSVSRTPVRAAIQRLVAEGLLEAAPTRGAIVSPWGDSDIEEVFQLRFLTEGLAAEWAASRITDDALDEMKRLNRDIATAVREKPKAYLEAVQEKNFRLHLTIYEACGSARLRTFGLSLLEYPLTRGGFFLYSDEDALSSVRQHEEIIRAMEARNGTWARAAIVGHLSAALERFRASRGNRSKTPET